MTNPQSNLDCRNELLVYGLKPPERVDFTPEYIKYDKLLSPPECISIINHGKAHGSMGIAGVGNAEPNQYRIDTDYRMVKSCSIEPHDGFEWLYTKVLQRLVWTNNERFHFDISGINEYIQLLWYQAPAPSTAEPAGHYNWHQDIGGGYSSLRKLSVVIQLSPPEDYDGCRLTLQTHRLLEVEERKQGDMIIFPAYLPHMVTPITRGERYALVLWVSGPPFR